MTREKPLQNYYHFLALHVRKPNEKGQCRYDILTDSSSFQSKSFEAICIFEQLYDLCKQITEAHRL